MDEWEQIAAQFGVEIEQVRRDHLVSHVLAAISSDISTNDVTFFGGTALSRTHLTDARLSEDIDLIARAPRRQVAGHIESAVRRGLARSHGLPSWHPQLSDTKGSQPAVLTVPAGTSIQIQLLSGEGYLWPTEVVRIKQRYSDAPPARLRVLTADSFAAAKLSAWIHRGAPRDLYDLWAMSVRGIVGPSAVEVFVAYGPFGRLPPAWVFDRGPDEGEWSSALANQTDLRVTAQDAMTAVRTAWLAAGGGLDSFRTK